MNQVEMREVGDAGDVMLARPPVSAAFRCVELHVGWTVLTSAYLVTCNVTDHFKVVSMTWLLC
jgi:hypothetical protein